LFNHVLQCVRAQFCMGDQADIFCIVHMGRLVVRPVMDLYEKLRTNPIRGGSYCCFCDIWKPATAAV
jgi:hypothetical protein